MLQSKSEALRLNYLLKNGVTIFLIAVDICLNAFMDQLEHTNSDRVIVFAIFAVQIILRLVLMLVVMMIFWETAPFKNGLLGVLASQFKYTLIMAPLSFIFMIIVRAMKLLATIRKRGPLELWDESGYITLVIIHNITSVLMYVTTLYACFMLSRREMYNAIYWVRQQT